ncbi:MAG: hypothetical protein WEC99_03575 [Halofilum sp. (in: g-proteobacteria)]
MNAEQTTPRAAEELILAVTGDAPRSHRARENLQRLLGKLGSDLHPREIDLTAAPEQSLAFGLFASPALVRVRDGQTQSVLYGDLSDEVRLRHFLGDLVSASSPVS